MGCEASNIFPLPGRIGAYSRSIIPSMTGAPLLFFHQCHYTASCKSSGMEWSVHNIVFLTPQFAVTGWLKLEDLAAVAALGFKSVLSNLPDGEARQYPSAAAEAEAATRVGLQFRHVPTTKSEVFSDAVVEGVVNALRDLEGPVLAHCASGLRSAIAWAAAASRSQPADCVLAALQAANFDLGALREELADQFGRPVITPIPDALDCRCAQTN